MSDDDTAIPCPNACSKCEDTGLTPPNSKQPMWQWYCDGCHKGADAERTYLSETIAMREPPPCARCGYCNCIDNFGVCLRLSERGIVFGPMPPLVSALGVARQ